MNPEQKLKLEKTDEEVVARILGLPLERVQVLKKEYEMPVSEPAFSAWFVEHPGVVLDELKRQDEIRVARLTPRHQKNSAKNGKNEGLHLSGVSVPAAYGS